MVGVRGSRGGWRSRDEGCLGMVRVRDEGGLGVVWDQGSKGL